MIKKKLIIVVPWILGILTIASLVVIGFVLYSSKTTFLRHFYNGSSASISGEYYIAADEFHEAMLVDRKNEELEEQIVYLMQIAKKNMDLVEYSSFVSYLLLKCPIADVEVENSNLMIDKAFRMIDLGEYQSALDMVKGMKIESPEVKLFYKNIYYRLTQQALDKEDYEQAFLQFLKAIDLETERDEKEEICVSITTEYIKKCEREYQYDEAIRAIERIYKYYDNIEALDECYENLKIQKAAYEKVLNELDDLYNIYRNDPNNDALLEQHMHKLYGNGIFRYEGYSSSLLKNDDNDSSLKTTGKGVSAYWDANILYVFFGRFESGMKVGEGILYQVVSDDYIKVFEGSWSNNLLDGNAMTKEDFSIDDPVEYEKHTDGFGEDIEVTNALDKTKISCDLIMSGYFRNGTYSGLWSGYSAIRGKRIEEDIDYKITYYSGFLLDENGNYINTDKVMVPGVDVLYAEDMVLTAFKLADD